MQYLNFEEEVKLDLRPARTLSDKALSLRVERLASHEAEVNLAALSDLQEFSNRKLYVDAKYSSLFSVCRSSVSFSPGPRCLECFLVRRTLRHRHWHAGFVDESCAADLLHAGMPLFSSPRGRLSRSIVRRAGSQARV